MGSLHPQRIFFPDRRKFPAGGLAVAFACLLVLFPRTAIHALPSPPDTISASADMGRSVSLPDCHIAFLLPPGYTVQKRVENWISAGPLAAPGGTALDSGDVFLIIGCNPNRFRTSRISEIKEGGHWDGGDIGKTIPVELDRGIPALLYPVKRLHGNRSIVSREAYFATREREYRLVLLHEKSDGIAISLLRSVRFTAPVDPTITEARYRHRLYAFATILALLGGVLAATLIRFKYKKKEHPV